jgi:hypothetical protein
MTKHFFYLMLVVSVVVQAFGSDSPAGDWGTVTNNLQMCIKLGGDMNEAKVGQPLDLIIRIRNLSTNETYFWIEPHTEVQDALYKIIVTAPSGKNVSPTMPYVPMAGSGATRSAEPGGTNVCDLNLENLFRFEEAGTYKISAQREIMGPIGNSGVRSNGLTIVTSMKEFAVSSNPLYVHVVQ